MNVEKSVNTVVTIQLNEDDAQKLQALLFAADWDMGEGAFFEELYDNLTNAGVWCDATYEAVGDEEVVVMRVETIDPEALVAAAWGEPDDEES